MLDEERKAYGSDLSSGVHSFDQRVTPSPLSLLKWPRFYLTRGTADARPPDKRAPHRSRKLNSKRCRDRIGINCGLGPLRFFHLKRTYGAQGTRAANPRPTTRGFLPMFPFSSLMNVGFLVCATRCVTCSIPDRKRRFILRDEFVNSDSFELPAREPRA